MWPICMIVNCSVGVSGLAKKCCTVSQFHSGCFHSINGSRLMLHELLFHQDEVELPSRRTKDEVGEVQYIGDGRTAT